MQRANFYRVAQGLALRSWLYSSYLTYLRTKKLTWVKSEEILSHFSATNTYEYFVEENETEEEHELLSSVVFD